MSFTILKEASIEMVKEYRREFTLLTDTSAGFSFPCDAHGNMTNINPDAQANYDYAVAHPELYKDDGIVEYKFKHREPAKGKCICGNEMELVNQYQGACECSNCGRWYNLFGQELLKPQYWEDNDSDYDVDYDYEPW